MLSFSPFFPVIEKRFLGRKLNLYFEQILRPRRTITDFQKIFCNILKFKVINFFTTTANWPGGFGLPDRLAGPDFSSRLKKNPGRLGLSMKPCLRSFPLPLPLSFFSGDTVTAVNIWYSKGKFCRLPESSNCCCMDFIFLNCSVLYIGYALPLRTSVSNQAKSITMHPSQFFEKSNYHKP